ncbi:hypothetical protein [Streptomyces cadmiisoli]|uniref:hypothetical protein n=1 Tax=Streptomyces cadmiisoli TaxID=2184053 RepID=UPI00364CB585
MELFLTTRPFRFYHVRLSQILGEQFVDAPRIMGRMPCTTRQTWQSCLSSAKEMMDSVKAKTRVSAATLGLVVAMTAAAERDDQNALDRLF